ncbi:MAG: molybdopterin-dependent oxidoreductase [Candidatus Tectomicrobia bacterium]|nr:molybdopterin-dependent oxidoreductase [Candidatus Tectomicrobia bacterium]
MAGILEATATSESQATRRETKIGLCGICAEGCGVEIQLVDGKIDSIAPLKDHPKGIVCLRGEYSKEIVYSPDRLRYPMVRVGARGEGKLERLSWDEALDRVAAGLKQVAQKHGGRALAAYGGRGNFEHSIGDFFSPTGTLTSSSIGLLALLGSPNAGGVSSLCAMSLRVMAPYATTGLPWMAWFPDVQRSDLIIIWGANPVTDSPPDLRRKIEAARQRGAKVVLIDPRRAEIARQEDQWIPVRPGSDGALALSLMQVLIEEDLYDHDFVENWTEGFAELRDYARQFRPERAEAICDIPAATIRALARDLGRARAASLVSYTGLEYTNSGVQNIRSAMCLWALLGQIDVPGGMVYSMHGQPTTRFLRFDPPEDVPPIGADRFPLFCRFTRAAHFMEMPRAILHNDPYPVRGLLVGGASLITSFPNPDVWRRSLAALDFLGVIDRFMTEDAKYADVVLPATTMYEILSYQRYPYRATVAQHVQVRERIVEPIGEARNDYLIYAAIADRLGFGHLVPQTEEEMLRYAFSESTVSLEEVRASATGVSLPVPEQRYRKYETGELRKDGKPGFRTPSGKFEFSSRLFRQHGIDPLPVYTEPTEGPLANPALAKEYPLVLISGSHMNEDFRSQHHNIPGLVNRRPDPCVVINSKDAQARGIKTGDRVYVTSPRRKKVVFTAQVTDDIRPGVIDANMGGGGPLGPKAWREANVNELTDMENRDPLSGFPSYKALLGNVEKLPA